MAWIKYYEAITKSLGAGRVCGDGSDTARPAPADRRLDPTAAAKRPPRPVLPPRNGPGATKADGLMHNSTSQTIRKHQLHRVYSWR